VSEKKASRTSVKEGAAAKGAPSKAAEKASAKKAGAKASTKESKSTKAEDLPDNWPLQADRMAITHPLADVLLILAGHYGRRTSIAALTGGLPIPPSGMTPLLFVRAAERADLNATLAERSLESLAIAPNLPCVLVLEHGQSCILWDVRDPKGSPKRDKNDKSVTVNGETRFLVQFPETQDDKQVMTLAELKPLYTGYAFFVRPVARRDERAGPAEIQEGRDWFWGVLKKNKTYLIMRLIPCGYCLRVFVLFISLTSSCVICARIFLMLRDVRRMSKFPRFCLSK